MYNPIPEDVSSYTHTLAFLSLVEERIMRSLTPLGYMCTSHPVGPLNDYVDVHEEFLTKGGISLLTKWIIHASSKRTINLLFTMHPIWSTIQMFDVPLCRAALWCFHIPGYESGLRLQYDAVVCDDLTSHKLTAPSAERVSKSTQTRIAKYMERYGMEMR